ncbi:MAG: dockerin type I repeat-containing protein [Bacilli bacterium]
MYIDKIIKKEVITLLTSVGLLLIIFIGVSFASFFSIKEGESNVIKTGDLSISFCSDADCDTTYSNIGQVIGTTKVDGVSVPSSIYPYPNDGTYSDSTPYIFKVDNTGSLESKITIKLKEDTDFLPTGNYAEYTRLTNLYSSHLKIAIRRRVLAPGSVYQMGDVNMDGIVSKADAQELLDILSGLKEEKEGVQNIADVDGNGTMDVGDAVLLLQSNKGISSSDIFPKTNIYSFSELTDGTILENDPLSAGESAIYFLWLYLDETTPNQAQKTYFIGNLDIKAEYIPKICKIASGTGKAVGDTIKCGTENFYVISNDGTNIKMLAKHELMVGSNADESNEGYGLQITEDDPNGLAQYPVMFDPGTNDYEESTIKNYVTKYNELLISKFGLSSSTVSSLISFEELSELGCSNNTCTTTNLPWLYSTSYWTKSTTADLDIAYAVRNNPMNNEFGYLNGGDADFNYCKYIDQVFSVRPLVTISVDDL